MELRPKNTKYNKYFKPSLKNKHKIDKLLYTGGIVCLQPSFISELQLQVIILSIKRILKRRGKVILRVFPHQPITKKPIQTRMGKGKGNICGWMQPVKAGSIILEIKAKSPLLVKTALKKIQNKLPFKSKIIIK